MRPSKRRSVGASERRSVGASERRSVGRRASGVGRQFSLLLGAITVLLAVEAAPAQDVTRYVRFQHDDRIAYGTLEGETIRELEGDLFSNRTTRRTHRVADVKLLAPIDPARVHKVVGVAINTRRPGREDPVPHPRFFAKMPTSIVGPGDAIEHPPEARNLDWEGELVLVIGRRGRHISVEDAPSYIFGVATGNDVSENTWYGERQSVDEPTRLFSKATDTWAALGPTIVTGVNYNDLDVEIRQNGDVVSTGNTSQMLNSPALLVSYLSRYITLEPGDLIYTGTFPTLRGKSNTIKPGDVVEVEIEGLGVLRNPVVEMQSPLPPPPTKYPAPSGGGGAPAFDPARVPQYEIDPDWPRPLPENWILGQVSGVHVDARNHVWIVQRPRTLTDRENGAMQTPRVFECCVAAPPVIEFDPDGNVVRAWGGKNDEYHWPDSEHGIYVDHAGHVWLASNGRNDNVVYKFSPDGKLLLMIGEPGQSGGSADTRLLAGPTDVAVDPETNHVFIADGYRNRRVVVFDAETGRHIRHWGAYGNVPSDEDLGPYDPDDPPAPQFRSAVHAIGISGDGLVYVADRANNRVQVFRKDGTFVREAFVAPRTLGTPLAWGAVWDLAFSPDAAQTYLYVADGGNMKIWILRRSDLEVVGSFGRGGRMAGQFEVVHNVAVDSQGNVYATEVNTGKRVQKFVVR